MGAVEYRIIGNNTNNFLALITNHFMSIIIDFSSGHFNEISRLVFEKLIGFRFMGIVSVFPMNSLRCVMNE